MQKLLRGNNGLTAINTLLLIGVLFISYEQNNKQAVVEKSISEIQSVLRWKLNIEVQNKTHHSPEQSEHRSPVSDMVLVDTRTEARKENN